MLKKKSSNKERESAKAQKLPQIEYEKKVLELAKNGLTAEKIGETLRQQGIHSKEYSKKISKILLGNNVYVIPDIKNTEEKLRKIMQHIEKNKQDKKTIREKDRVFSQLKRLKRNLKI